MLKAFYHISIVKRKITFDKSFSGDASSFGFYFGCNDGYLCAINSNCGGLAASPWPMLLHDVRQTGNVKTFIPKRGVCSISGINLILND
jgi:hypothetical protein